MWPLTPDAPRPVLPKNRLSKSQIKLVMGNVRIENADSKAYRLDIKVSGSSSVLEIRASTTASYSWSGGARDAEVRGGGAAFPGSVIKVGV